ncbi:flagellar protein FlaG [Clostridium sp. A1-XYC3]|uniref:Flagellar protein FlaG n=1 Tax=Clostridium tanneri TaxID=3037988 RepID=A0ABU4JP12_9CLOT|nr:flagellar protein FlaG [Clostridium sp. A1-XYC3]MDW8799701.1 flagellar protein FlaG [Clostridium sp. A1-XYC3]
MEVNNIGQGRQASLNLNTGSIDNSNEDIQGISLNNNLSDTDSKSSELGYQLNNNQDISEKDIKKAIDKFNKLLEDNDTHVEYELYGKTKELTIKIINNKTKEIVKELPPKRLIDMINKLCELAGVFVDQKA